MPVEGRRRPAWAEVDLVALAHNAAPLRDLVAPALAGSEGPVFHLCQGYEGDFTFYAHFRAAIEDAYRSPTHKLTVSETLAKN